MYFFTGICVKQPMFLLKAYLSSTGKDIVGFIGKGKGLGTPFNKNL